MADNILTIKTYSSSFGSTFDIISYAIIGASWDDLLEEWH